MATKTHGQSGDIGIKAAAKGIENKEMCQTLPVPQARDREWVAIAPRIPPSELTETMNPTAAGGESRVLRMNTVSIANWPTARRLVRAVTIAIARNAP